MDGKDSFPWKETAMEAAVQRTVPEALVKSSPLRTLQIAPDKAERANRIQIAGVVTEVEIAKQLKPPLTKQQARWLIDEIDLRAWSIGELHDRAESVILKPTFGSIAIEHWIGDLVCTRTEAEQIAREIVAENRRRFFELGGKAPEETLREACEQGLAVVKELWQLQAMNEARRVRDEFQARCKKLRSQVIALPEEDRLQLWKIGLEKGVIKHDDKHGADLVRYFIPELVEEAEQLVRSRASIPSSEGAKSISEELIKQEDQS